LDISGGDGAAGVSVDGDEATQDASFSGEGKSFGADYAESV